MEEQDRAERLVLGGGSDVPFDGQGAEEASDLGRPHLRGVALVVEEDVPPDPRDVGVLGASAVVASAKSATDAIEQARLRGLGRAGLTEGEHDARPRAVRRYRIQKRMASVNADHGRVRPWSGA